MKGTVVVTGGAGFIGSHVIEQLTTMGYEVISIDPRPKGNIFVKPESAKYWNAFVQNVSPWSTMLGRGHIKHTIHLGAWSNVRESMTKPERLYLNNTMSTAHLIEGLIQAAGRSKVQSIVFASSSAADAPESHYGVSKAASEMMLDVFREQMEGRISVSNLRFANVYGPRQNPANGTLIAKFIDCIFTGNRPQIYGDGKQERDYIYVTGVVDAIITCMLDEGGPAGFTLSDTMNVSTGISSSVDEVYDTIKSAAGSMGFDLRDPDYLDAKPGDKDIVRMYPSQALLAAAGSTDVCLYDGIKSQIDWCNDMQGSWDDDHYVDGRLV